MSDSDFQPREGDSAEIAGALNFLRSRVIETLLSALSVEPARSTMSEENGFLHTIGHLFKLQFLPDYSKEMMSAVNRLDSKFLRSAADALDAVRKYNVMFPPPHNSPPRVKATTPAQRKVLHIYAALRVIARHVRHTGSKNGGKVVSITKKDLKSKVESLLQEEGTEPSNDGKFWASLFDMWEIRSFTERERGGGRPQNSVGKKPL